jgi:RNA polymerase-interacting CarD/CdnL/TRCF family regulator
MSALALDHSTASLSRVRNALTLAAGDKAIYPGVGPCLIGRVEKRIVDARVVMFYHLVVLDGSRCELFIPVEKAGHIGVRLMISKSEVPKLLAHLQETNITADNWKQRASDNSKLFTSGSPFDLAKIVASLTELSDSRSLTVGDSRTLLRARALLICEISEVMGETKTAAEEQVDQALRERWRGTEDRLKYGAATASPRH